MADAEEQELKLLREVHHFARGVMRYNGVDSARCNSNYDKMVAAVHLVTDFYNECDEDDDK